MGKFDKFARLKAARAGKKITDIEDEKNSNVDIYDEVDEMEYRKHKRDQLLNDDFIVDENGEGYAETGADEWEHHEDYYSEDEEDDNIGETTSTPRKKRVKKVRNKKSEITRFFKPTAAKPVKTEAKVDISNLDDILADFTNTAVQRVKADSIFGSEPKKDIFSSVKHRRARDKTSSPKLNVNRSKRAPVSVSLGSPVSKKAKLSSEPEEYYTAIDFDDYQNVPSSPTKNDRDTVPKTGNKIEKNLDAKKTADEVVKAEADNEPQNSSAVQTKKTADADLDDSSDDDDIVVAKRRTTAFVDRDVNLSSSKAKPILKHPLNSSPFKDTDVNSSSVASVSSPVRFSDSSFYRLNEDEVITKDESGEESLKMYWLDFAEVDGSLLLFGKVQAADGSMVSGVVQVNGINREIYFLPRERRKQVEQEEDDESEEDNDEKNDEKKSSKITTNDVYEEIVPLLMDKYGLSFIKAKPETKKYAFELPGIPHEAEYLKVLLPYQTKKCRNMVIPADLEGETFWHVFNANADIFESFVLQRNIMGPCWLEIKKPDFKQLQNATHCNVEVTVSSPDYITPLSADMPPPTLNVLAINVQSFMSMKSGKQEIGSVSLALYKDLPQNRPIESGLKPDEETTLVRPPGASLAFPPGLKQLAQKKGMVLRTFNNERAMLNCLAAIVKKSDPDVFIGHKLENVTLDILMHRMYDLKVSTWSYFGRINRKQFPNKFGRNSGRNNMFYLKEILQGRLICDIANNMGQSLTPKCQSWDLAEMYEIYCKKKYTPMEVNLANPAFGEDAGRLLAAFNENRMAVKMIGDVTFGIQILSLSKQLTNLAGNAWSRTLGGTRAGRNEYILLHEFTRNGYIVPDKEKGRQKRHGTSDNEPATAAAGRKAKYQGGLVFEPVKGLVKNYVTVMDFNSLYPSIIQEFNICFTTVDRSKLTEDELPEVPSPETPRGVLPKLLHELVSRRREVKKLLKDPRISTQERIQYDIKQRALKVTANSMYGCLGYANSRFYAKPLAMLVTNRGREILMDTRHLAESLGMRVVYGDTDSVMVDTGCDTMKEALKFAEDFRKRVNDRYKLLEIGIDNVFKKMLLHAKKKYAAVNCTINADGKESTSLEVKGLDMKRREYCPLSKEVSTFILEKVLGDNDPEQALTAIYGYLEGITTKLKDNNIPMVKLKINTRLSKDPVQYPGGKTMPAVQVALRLRDQGKIVKAGSVITFIITNEDADKGASVAERARSIQEVLSDQSKYEPDSDFYLEKQLFAPISRLLEKIEGYDVVRLAQSLGLDSRKYEARARSLERETGLQPLESTVTDSERFRDAKDFLINCPKCQASIKFGGIQSSQQYRVTFSGIKCGECDSIIPVLSVTAQLEHFIRHEISLYYAGYLTCSDCGLTTRQVSVYGRRCIGGQGTARSCKGVMKYCYTDRMLYNQLLYLQSLFDVEKAKKRTLKPLYDITTQNKDDLPPELNQGELDALVEQSRPEFGVIQSVVTKYLDDCGRRYVDMGSIFGFLK